MPVKIKKMMAAALCVALLFALATPVYAQAGAEAANAEGSAPSDVSGETGDIIPIDGGTPGETGTDGGEVPVEDETTAENNDGPPRGGVVTTEQNPPGTDAVDGNSLTDGDRQDEEDIPPTADGTDIAQDGDEPQNRPPAAPSIAPAAHPLNTEWLEFNSHSSLQIAVAQSSYASSPENITGVKVLSGSFTTADGEYLRDTLTNVTDVDLSGHGATLADKLFMNNARLLRVTMPSDAIVGESAFQNCASLEKIDLEDVKTLESTLFPAAPISPWPAPICLPVLSKYPSLPLPTAQAWVKSI